MGWKNDPVTNLVLQEVSRRRETVKEGIAQAKLSGDELQRAIGICLAFQDILAIDYPEAAETEPTDD